MSDWAPFLGRFHPLVLHFPIGLLSAAFLLTLASRVRGLERYDGAARIVLRLGALATVVAAILGWLLALEGGYDETVVGLHRWSGIALAALTVPLAWMARRPEVPRAFLPAFAAAMALMVWVGHLGGTLTHGEGYLVAHAPGSVRALLGGEPRPDEGSLVVEDLERAPVRDALVLPVLDAACTECHNPIKRKGGLDLSTADGLAEGGETGPVVSGDGALRSELFRRLILPAGHEDAMPPAGRARIAPEDVELIGWWLDEGASPDATVTALEPDDRRLRMLRERFGRPDPLERLRIRPASDRAIARANGGAFIVERIAESSPWLRARLRGGAREGAPSLGILRRVRDRIIELDLGASGFDDDAAAALADFEHLRRLDLHDTAVTDAALEDVARLAYLGSLDLHGTRVTAAGLAALSGLEHLERVYAWKTGLTRRDLSDLSDPGPTAGRLRIDLGVDSTGFAPMPLPAPTVSIDSALFAGRATVSMGGSIPGSEIRYTVDGSDPTDESPLFGGPFTVTRSTRVRAIATRPGWLASPVGEAVALQRGYSPAALRLSTSPDPEYPGEGEATLRDGVLGTDVFRSPRWLGYQDSDLVAVIDLGAVEEVGEVTVSILENIGAWIFPPAAVDVSLSADGTTYRSIASARHEGPTGDRSPSRSLLVEPFEPQDARWVRVRVRRFGALPGWHPGAGQPAWLFVDEILVGPGGDPGGPGGDPGGP